MAIEAIEAIEAIVAIEAIEAVEAIEVVEATGHLLHSLWGFSVLFKLVLGKLCTKLAFLLQKVIIVFPCLCILKITYKRYL